MKDAKGHGSDTGLHSGGIQKTPQLQRRHFEAIAAELRAEREPLARKAQALGDASQTPHATPLDVTRASADLNAHTAKVNAMADKLATTNPGFRRDFFIKAATGGDYRFKGPGKNAASVTRTAAKYSQTDKPNWPGYRGKK